MYLYHLDATKILVRIRCCIISTEILVNEREAEQLQVEGTLSFVASFKPKNTFGHTARDQASGNVLSSYYTYYILVLKGRTMFLQRTKTCVSFIPGIPTPSSQAPDTERI